MGDLVTVWGGGLGITRTGEKSEDAGAVLRGRFARHLPMVYKSGNVAVGEEARDIGDEDVYVVHVLGRRVAAGVTNVRGHTAGLTGAARVSGVDSDTDF